MRKKHIWLPIVLAIYFLFMTFKFGIHLLDNGEALKFWITVVSEAVVLIALHFVLKRRQQYRDSRKADMNGENLSDNINNGK